MKVEFRYDYLGRRIEKRVLPWNPALNGGAGGWEAGSPTKVTRYVWSGWLMLLELDGLRDCGSPASPAECIVRKYTWGLDLAGQNGQVNSLESAGAISGLLAAYDPNANLPLWYFYDANGNVGQVVTMVVHEGTVYRDFIPAARYEYDPYGNRINPRAANEYEQPLQYSTKQWDLETGLLYFGLRYRDRDRWINRDPIGELGGIGLYTYARNSPIIAADPLGLQADPDLESLDREYARRYPPIDFAKATGSRMRPYRSLGDACEQLEQKLIDAAERRVNSINDRECEGDKARRVKYGRNSNDCCCPYKLVIHRTSCDWSGLFAWSGPKEFVGAYRNPDFDISSGVGSPITGMTVVHKGYSLVYQVYKVRKVKATLAYDIVGSCGYRVIAEGGYLWLPPGYKQPPEMHDPDPSKCCNDCRKQHGKHGAWFVRSSSAYAVEFTERDEDVRTRGWYQRRQTEDEAFGE